MRATELREGMLVVTDHRPRWLWRIKTIGSGRSAYHRAAQCDLDGNPILDEAGREIIRSFSSRNLDKSWEQFLRERPTYLKELEDQKFEQEARDALKETMEGLADEVVGLLATLGIEARTSFNQHWQRGGSYWQRGDSDDGYGSVAYQVVIPAPSEAIPTLREIVGMKFQELLAASEEEE